MSVFPLKFRNSAFLKALILYQMKIFLYRENPLSLTLGEIAIFKSPSLVENS